MQAADPERLVDVDVAEPRDPALIEQRRLQRCASPFEPVPELGGGERPERLRAEPRLEVRMQLTTLEELPRPEATDVAIRDVRSIV